MLGSATGLRQRCSNSRILGTILFFLISTAFSKNIYGHAGNSDPNAIHGCVHRESRQIRIVGVRGACGWNETPIHWSPIRAATPSNPTEQAPEETTPPSPAPPVQPETEEPAGPSEAPAPARPQPEKPNHVASVFVIRAI